MIQKNIDLHCHSYYSDGTFSPQELVTEAKRKGLSALALTDHDTIEGLKEFEFAGKQQHFETITGIEFAAEYKSFGNEDIHIVGLGFSPSSKILSERVNKIVEEREIRNQKMIQACNRIGIPICYEDLKKVAQGNIITRAHFSAVLIQKKIVRNTKEAFEKYLSEDRPAFVQRKILTPAECIETIKKSGGVSVLAHATLYHMNMQQIYLLAEELKSYGLTAIETDYSSYTSEQSTQLKKIADKLDLLYSGGSDFHGKNRAVQLGIGNGNLNIPYEYWTALKSQCHLSFY